MATETPTVTLADLQRLSLQANRPTPLTTEEVEDFAVVLRGMRRGDKLRVLRRARRLLGGS
jgi:hypothetical protein